MKLFFTLIFLIYIPLNAYLQENKLAAFVEEQNSKLIYQESKLTKVPNLNIFLIPPEYFEVDSSINGYVHPGSATTVQILEIPNHSFNDIDSKMTTEYIASQAYEFVERQEFRTVTGQPAVLYFVRFFSNEIEYERCMFFSGIEKTIWINVNYPLSIKKLIFPQIEAMLFSVQTPNNNYLNSTEK